MNFLSMEYFIAVASRRNITQAAKELHITQQTLSAHIAAIENELACPLIVRSNPLELTYAGERFWHHAAQIYEDYQSMWNEFNDLTNNQRGKLLVGIDYMRSRTIMPHIISVFQSVYPNMAVRIVEGNREALHQKLTNKDIDLAVTRFPEPLPNITIQDFFQEEIVMLAAKELLHEKFEESERNIDTLAGFETYPFLLGDAGDYATQIGREILLQADFEPRIKAQSNNVETLLSLCLRGVGICFCPFSMLRSVLSKEQYRQVCIYHFAHDTTYPIRFGYRKTSYQWKMILEFIRIAKEEEQTIFE